MIPVDLLKRFYRAQPGGEVVRTYIDKNPLVRWLYWDRLRRMLDLGKEIGGTRILDLGCGEGVFLPALSETFDQVYGLDVDVRAAREVVKHYDLRNVQLYDMGLFDNPFDDGLFDIIFAASVLEHFPDRDRLFTEILRLMGADAHLIASCPTESRFYELGRKVFGYTKPDDHHFSADQISSTAERYLEMVFKKQGPFAKPRVLAVYYIYVFRKLRKAG